MTYAYENNLAFAQNQDAADALAAFRQQFLFPTQPNGEAYLYFCGNSLGLQPKTVRPAIEQELEDWAKFGVEGHFHAKHPWMPYHAELTEMLAEVAGALPHEVVAMNSLTVNLHLLMVSFYRPTKERYKIAIEANAFPSDQYAVKSQLKFHGFDPETDLIEFKPREGETLLRTEDILQTIQAEGSNLALVLLGGVNYYTGQLFDLETITQAAQAVGATVGLDLAHAAGNVPLRLHQWGPDFAAWCSYKYLNAGPGSTAAIFVHERHARREDLPRFEGWWGHRQDTRFKMNPNFAPAVGAEAWQLSNPPIFPMAALRASLEIFRQAGMENLRAKSLKLTGYLLFLLDELKTDRITVITPRDASARGCQLTLRVAGADRSLLQRLLEAGVICDWREPDAIRVAPAPLYNSFQDVFEFVQRLGKLV